MESRHTKLRTSLTRSPRALSAICTETMRSFLFWMFAPDGGISTLTQHKKKTGRSNIITRGRLRMNAPPKPVSPGATVQEELGFFAGESCLQQEEHPRGHWQAAARRRPGSSGCGAQVLTITEAAASRGVAESLAPQTSSSSTRREGRRAPLLIALTWRTANCCRGAEHLDQS